MATRAQIVNVQTNFCGIDLHSPSYNLPLFSIFLGSMPNFEDRGAVYSAYHTAGFTHLAVALSYNYLEIAYPLPGADYTGGLGTTSPTNTLGQFHDLLIEIIENGLFPIVFCAGDGTGSGPGYDDPVGWTYGVYWLADNFDAIASAVFDDPIVQQNALIVPGFEVLDAWTAAELEMCMTVMRSRLPNAFIGIELGTNQIDWGGGPGDWTSTVGQGIDALLLEIPDPINAWTQGALDNIQQITSRTIGPAAVNIAPANQGPYYLAAGTPRGPYGLCMFEYAAPDFIRGNVSENDCNTASQIMSYYGLSSFGNGSAAGGPIPPPAPTPCQSTTRFPQMFYSGAFFAMGPSVAGPIQPGVGVVGNVEVSSNGWGDTGQRAVIAATPSDIASAGDLLIATYAEADNGVWSNADIASKLKFAKPVICVWDGDASAADFTPITAPAGQIIPGVEYYPLSNDETSAEVDARVRPMAFALAAQYGRLCLVDCCYLNAAHNTYAQIEALQAPYEQLIIDLLTQYPALVFLDLWFAWQREGLGIDGDPTLAGILGARITALPNCPLPALTFTPTPALITM